MWLLEVCVTCHERVRPPLTALTFHRPRHLSPAASKNTEQFHTLCYFERCSWIVPSVSDDFSSRLYPSNVDSTHHQPRETAFCADLSSVTARDWQACIPQGDPDMMALCVNLLEEFIALSAPWQRKKGTGIRGTCTEVEVWAQALQIWSGHEWTYHYVDIIK